MRSVERVEGGDVTALPRAGGLHYRYSRAACFGSEMSISPPQAFDLTDAQATQEEGP